MAQRWHTLNLLMIGAAGGDTGGDPCGDRGLCRGGVVEGGGDAEPAIPVTPPVTVTACCPDHE